MKQKIIYSFIVMLLALPALVKAQVTASPVIYKEWYQLGESNTQMDVSGKIIKCTSVNQIHLQIFNENPNDQTAHFELEIKNNADGAKFLKEISFAAQKAKIYTAKCDSDASFDVLKIDLPADYNPMNINVKLTFKP